jgi:hypothetical protein
MVQITILNMCGVQIMQEIFTNQNRIEMDVSRLTKGIYLVKLQTPAGIETKKLIIH